MRMRSVYNHDCKNVHEFEIITQECSYRQNINSEFLCSTYIQVYNYLIIKEIIEALEILDIIHLSLPKWTFPK